MDNFSFDSLKDRWGTPLDAYDIEYDIGIFERLDGILEACVALLYNVLAKPLALLAAWIMNAVSEPQQVMSLLEKAYAWAFRPLFSLVDPQLLALLVATFVMLVMFFSKKTVMSVPQEELIQNFFISMGMVILAAQMMVNPFYLLRRLFAIVSDLMGSIAREVTGLPGQERVSAEFLTTLTQLINFGTVLPDKHAQAWAAALKTGTSFKDVPELASYIQDVPPGAVFSSLAGSLASLAMLAFSLIILAYFVYYTFEMSWRCVVIPAYLFYAAVVHRKIDNAAYALARTISYAGMVLLITISAIAGPYVAIGVITTWLGNSGAFVQVFISIIAYCLMSWMVYTLYRPDGKIAEFARLSGQNQWGGPFQRSALGAAAHYISTNQNHLPRPSTGTTDTTSTGIETSGVAAPDGTTPSQPAGVSVAPGSRMVGGPSQTFAVGGPTGPNSTVRENTLMSDVPKEAFVTAFDAAPPAPQLDEDGRGGGLDVPVYSREVLDGGGMGSGDGESYRLLNETTLLVGTGNPGAEGSAVVGHTPQRRVVEPEPQPRPEVEVFDAKDHALFDAASSTMMYAPSPVEGEVLALSDPRAPLPEFMREEIISNPVRGFADVDAVRDMYLPEGVAVFAGRTVWTSPSSVAAVGLRGDSGGMEDTVTREGMRELAAEIEDDDVRGEFMRHHRLDPSFDGVLDVPAPEPDSVVDDSVGVEPVVPVSEPAVLTLGDTREFVRDVSPEMGPEPGVVSENGTSPQPQLVEPTQPVQPMEVPRPSPQSVLSPRAIVPEVKESLDSQVSVGGVEPVAQLPDVGLDQSQVSDTGFVQAEERPAAGQSVESSLPKRTPEDLARDLEVLDRHDAAGRSGSSRASREGSTYSSVLERTFVPPEPFVEPVTQVASFSVEDATFAASRSAAVEESRLVSAAMAYGGVAAIPEDDPLLDNSFEVVNGENVVQTSGSLMTW